mmetsp:Transcript_11715/g.38549  ORF Transcript_11715/g.38549 Transcript_11715/m.38549 type:complete len:202 (-) Transcript_11715:198-803(-)
MPCRPSSGDRDGARLGWPASVPTSSRSATTNIGRRGRPRPSPPTSTAGPPSGRRPRSPNGRGNAEATSPPTKSGNNETSTPKEASSRRPAGGRGPPPSSGSSDQRWTYSPSREPSIRTATSSASSPPGFRGSRRRRRRRTHLLFYHGWRWMSLIIEENKQDTFLDEQREGRKTDRETRGAGRHHREGRSVSHRLSCSLAVA